MAIVNQQSVQYAQLYGTTPPVPVHASFFGKTLTMMATIETAASDVGAVISMFRPPKGCRWNGIGALWSDAQGAARTLAVGIAGTAAKFLAATSVAAAAKIDFGLVAAIDSVMYEFDGDTDVILTNAGDTVPAGATVHLMMQFVQA